MLQKAENHSTELKYKNLAHLNREVCRCLGPKTGITFKRYGKYVDLSWSEFRKNADQAASGLIDLGVNAGDRVAILSENRYEWIIADQSIFSAGAVNVPLHAPLAPVQVEYQLSHSDACGVIVSNQSQADKVFEVLDNLPDLKFLISFDPIEVPQNISQDRLTTYTWAGLKQRGFQSAEKHQDEIAAREKGLTHDDLATIIYTSGTTGRPKGVMLTHGNLVSNVETVLTISDIEPHDVLLSWLPYSHIYARTVDIYLSQLAGITIALAENVDTILVNLAETRPSRMTAVPRFYEKVWMHVETYPPEKQPFVLKKIFGPMMRCLMSGGAPLPKQICEKFKEYGQEIYEGYGLTETSPVISYNTIGDCKPGTVGLALPGVEVKIAEDGEILSKGPHIMKGYWKDPEATAKAIVDEWFHTGDIGNIDEEGYLSITGRKKDLIVTSSGKNVAPAEIEHLLSGLPLIDQAVVYGDGRNYLTALLAPNFDVLTPSAAELGIDWTSDNDTEFIKAPGIYHLVAEQIREVMQQVSRPERVRKFLLLNRPFSLEEKELTATLKVRRSHIIEKYNDVLSGLYEESPEHLNVG